MSPILFIISVTISVNVVFLLVLLKEMYDEVYPAEFGPCFCGKEGSIAFIGSESGLPHYECKRHSNKKIPLNSFYASPICKVSKGKRHK